MRHARIFSLSVFLALLVYGALGYALLPLAFFEGDLTRLAMLPERQFGWTRDQPAISPAWLQQSSMRDADVLVIGDSFSMSRVWQSTLTREGVRVRTDHWDNLRAVCADLPDHLRQQGFHGRHVVLQVVERNLERVVRDSVACTQTRHRLKHPVDGVQSPPAQHFKPDQIDDHSGRLSVGVRTWLHARELEHKAQAADFSAWHITPDVRVARVPDGCRLFSHARCEEALFWAEDRAQDVSPEVAQDMARLAARLEGPLPGVTVTWVVVPNKSTVYLHPDKQFWDRSEALVRAPNLLRMARRQLAQHTTDLYLGNNTHFSTAGYLLMGQAIRETMERAR